LKNKLPKVTILKVTLFSEDFLRVTTFKWLVFKKESTFKWLVFTKVTTLEVTSFEEIAKSHNF